MDLGMVNWWMVLPIFGMVLFVGVGLTMKSRVLDRRAIESIEAVTEIPVEDTPVVTVSRMGLSDLLPFKSEKQKEYEKSVAYLVARGDEKREMFSDPAKLKLHYASMKIRFALIGAIVGVILGGLLMLNKSQFGIIALVALPTLGYATPELMARSGRKKMREEVVGIIPDLLGYLSAFVGEEAQLIGPLELIMDNDEENADNVLYASLRKAIGDLQAGGDFYEELTENANALGVDEWKSVVFTLVQAHRMSSGRSMVSIIKEVEADFREERQLTLEMAASKVSTNLSFYMSLMFMPAIYTYTMAPAYMMLFQNFL